MPKSTYQMRIIGSVTVFIVLLGLAFVYGFPWLSSLNRAKLEEILASKKVVIELKQEQANVEQAKKDLQDLSSKVRVPEEFFSKDITLVDDLRILEAKAKESAVDMTLSVSGTLNTAVKAKTASELYSVPFSVQLKGDFKDVVAYMDFLEHFGTLFTVRSVSMLGGTSDVVTANLVGNFYLRK